MPLERNVAVLVPGMTWEGGFGAGLSVGGPDRAPPRCAPACRLRLKPLQFGGTHPSRTEVAGMAKVGPYHTTSPEYPPKHRNVYHDHDDCPAGREIQQRHRVPGKGDRPRCDDCIRLG